MSRVLWLQGGMGAAAVPRAVYCWSHKASLLFSQDTLNNNSLGKKHSWQERVSRSSSPLKTGEFSGCWPGAAPCTLAWLSAVNPLPRSWGKQCWDGRLGKTSKWIQGMPSLSLVASPATFPSSADSSVLLSFPSR